METCDEVKHELWNEGANYTADPIVLTDDGYVLLIRRQNGSLALPGGFVDDGEVSAEHAARREAHEEAGIILNADGLPIYSGPVDDIRNTDTRWIETSAFLYSIPTTTELTPDYSEVLEALWVHVDAIPEVLYGSHAMLIDAAVKVRWPFSRLLVEHGYAHSPAEGGHMGYDRMVATHQNSPAVFIKRHNPARFSDAERECHSLQYLRKESGVYTWLQQQAADYVPSVHEFTNDSLLMDAYQREQGWHWRAPKNESERERYISDAIAAAESIGHLKHDESIEHEVRNTYVSIKREGWPVYQTKSEQIKKMLAEHGEAAVDLLDNLDSLHSSSLALPELPSTRLAHHDFRQSNIAWHPEHGIRIVDWSWAGPGFGQDDTTSLLIDLAKSGYDISAHLDYIDPDHALRLMGFWLCHAVDKPAPGNNNVRSQQLISAITAHRVRNMVINARQPTLQATR